jgi:putative membrane protein
MDESSTKGIEPENTADTNESAAAQEQTEWQRKVLYHHRTRTALGNERKYLGWLRVSLGLITLGFVVERLDLFLAKTAGLPTSEVRGVLIWAPLVIYSMGCVTIAAATWDFFADRKHIAAERTRSSRVLVGLVLMTLVCVLLIAILLWVPGVRRISP